MMTRHTTKPGARDEVAAKSGEAQSGNGQAAAEHAGHAVQQGVAASLTALETVEAQIAALARKTVADTLGIGGGAAAGLTAVIEQVVRGALAASEHVGTGLTMSVRGVSKGIVTGVHDVGGDIVLASFDTMRALIMAGAALGADLGTIARQAIAGILDAVGETGGDAGRIGARAAEGAISAAGDISNMAVGTVREVLVGITGASHAGGAGLPQPGRHGQGGAARH